MLNIACQTPIIVYEAKHPTSYPLHRTLLIYTARMYAIPRAQARIHTRHMHIQHLVVINILKML